MKRYRQVAAFILAGGASSRMGTNKSLLKLEGVPLVVRTTRLLEPLVSGVTVVGPIKSYVALGLDAIDDQIPVQHEKALPHQGPLAGITRALHSTTASWNLIVAGDLPYLSSEWIDWLLSRATASEAQAIVPRTSRGLEPLAAVYRRECAAPLSAAFRRGVRSVSEALNRLRLELVDVNEWSSLDRAGGILKNMNTPADYAEARKWWESEGQRQRVRVKRPESMRNLQRPTAPRRRK